MGFSPNWSLNNTLIEKVKNKKQTFSISDSFGFITLHVYRLFCICDWHNGMINDSACLVLGYMKDKKYSDRNHCQALTLFIMHNYLQAMKEWKAWNSAHSLGYLSHILTDMYYCQQIGRLLLYSVSFDIRTAVLKNVQFLSFCRLIILVIWTYCFWWLKYRIPSEMLLQVQWSSSRWSIFSVFKFNI